MINTEEVFIGISTELACGLGLALTYYEDVDAIDGGYLEFEAGKSFELTECASLDLAAGAAWSYDYNSETVAAGDGTMEWF